jgi:hypothetical protein
MTRILRKILILWFMVTSVSGVACAQTDSSFGGILSSDASMVWRDAGGVIAMPFHFSSSQWLTTGAVCGGTILLFTADESVRSFSQRNISEVGDRFSEFGTQYGRAIYGLSLAGGLYSGGIIFHSRDVRLTGLMLFESMGFAGATTIVLKGVFGRSRPFVEEDRKSVV